MNNEYQFSNFEKALNRFLSKVEAIAETILRPIIGAKGDAADY